MEANCMLVSIGSKPNANGLGLNAIGLEVNNCDQIKTNHNFCAKVD